MNNSLAMEPTAAKAEEFRQFLQQGLAEMDRLFALMAEDQKEIDRLAISSKENLRKIQAVSEQTDAILATLKFS